MYIAGIGISDLFGSCDLDLDQMTFIYELDPRVPVSGRFDVPDSRKSPGDADFWYAWSPLDAENCYVAHRG